MKPFPCKVYAAVEQDERKWQATINLIKYTTKKLELPVIVDNVIYTHRGGSLMARLFVVKSFPKRGTAYLFSKTALKQNDIDFLMDQAFMVEE